MKILGKSISTQLESLYQETASKVGIPFRFERLPSGRSGFGQYRIENGVARILLRTDMPKAAFEHVCAHELMHAVQDAEKWPRTARRRGLPDTSLEAQVSTELQSLVRDLDVEQWVQSLGFDPELDNARRYENSMRRIGNEKAPFLGGPWWCIWSIRYAYLFLTQTPERWGRLRARFLAHAPSIAAKGEEIVAILSEHGWSNRDQALRSLVAIRDCLGLATDGRIQVFDLRTNTAH